MKHLLFLFVFVLSAFAEDSDVVVLTDESFDETIQKNENVFVEFYAPWCGHCKSLAPEYEKVATAFKGKNVVIAKVDATEHSENANKYGVRGYPTLKFFRNGTPMDYKGGRSAEDLISWITKKSGPPSVLIFNQEALDAFVAAVGVQVVAYLEKDSKVAEQWEAASKSVSLDAFSLGHVTDSSVFGDKKANSIVIFKENEEPLVYDGPLESEKIVSWILTEGFPLIEELDAPIWERSTTQATPLFVGFVNVVENEEQLNLIKDLAKKFKGKLLFSWSSNTNYAERWGASGNVIPTAIVVTWKSGNPKMVIFNEESEQWNAESVEAYITKALSGEYQGFRKSEPIPETNDGPVTTLVGKNFEDIVNNKDKDVFVEFYAPWCGHCKKLTPVWEELGEAFKAEESVVIAKIDATANSVPDNIDIQGFPTLIFFPANNKEGVPYSGDRDLKSMTDFVLQQASKKITLSEKEKLDL